MTEATVTPEDFDEVVQIGRALLGEWNAVTNVEARAKGFNPAKVATCYGFAAHAHHLSPLALDLIEAGRVLEALPLVRLIYECSLQAHWVAQVPDAIAALDSKEYSSRRALVAELGQSMNLVLRQASEEIKSAMSTWTVDETTASARFRGVCEDLQPGGIDAYLHYRMLSSLSHATPMIADQYISAIDGPPGFQIRASPHESPGVAYAYTVAVSLVWAGRAMDFQDKRHHRRSELRAAARRLGVPDVLPPSETAMKRQR